jgi:F-type H+-transporting ATPase subunit alpha
MKLNEGFVDGADEKRLGEFEKALHDHMAGHYKDLMDKINSSGDWNDELEAEMRKGVEEFATTGSY